MKRIVGIILMLMIMSPLIAKELPKHYVTMDLFGGLASEMPESSLIAETNPQYILGAQGGLSIGYAFKQKHFLLQTGCRAAFQYMNGELADFVDSVPSIDSQGDEYMLKMSYANINLNARALQINIPLLAGAQWGKFYFLMGPAFSLKCARAYQMNADLTTTAEYPFFWDPFENMPNHGLTTQHLQGEWETKTITWGVDAQVEIGWLMSAASPGYHTTRAVIPEWRMALYADVGLWNTQAIKIPNNYSVGLRFSVWLNIPRSYPCRCVIDNL